jgi:hypothetical protein
VPLPEAQPGHVNVEGAKLLAQTYAKPERAESAFGCNIRKAGLLPVRFVIDNQTQARASVYSAQTFLIDREGQASPLLSSEQAYDRVKAYVDVGETVAGGAAWRTARSARRSATTWPSSL